MKPEYKHHIEETARLTILKALYDENDLRMNEALLASVLDVYGFRKSRDWVRTQMRKLEDLGAVTLSEAGTVLIAALTRTGSDHIERRTFIEGVRRPSEP